MIVKSYWLSWGLARGHRLDCDCLPLSSSSTLLRLCLSIEHSSYSRRPSCHSRAPASFVLRLRHPSRRQHYLPLIRNISSIHRATSPPNAGPQTTSTVCGSRRRRGTVCTEEADKRHRIIIKSCTRARVCCVRTKAPHPAAVTTAPTASAGGR